MTRRREMCRRQGILKDYFRYLIIFVHLRPPLHKNIFIELIRNMKAIQLTIGVFPKWSRTLTEFRKLKN